MSTTKNKNTHGKNEKTRNTDHDNSFYKSNVDILIEFVQEKCFP